MATFSTGEEAEDGTRRLSSAVVHGAIGGALATVTMTVYRLPIARSLPPTREFWAQYGPDGVEAGSVIALILHLAYGIIAGVAFTVLFERAFPRTGSDATREGASLVLGVLYGVALSVFGSRVVLSRVLSMDLDADEGLVFHVSHLVYALTLGTWVGSRAQSAD